MAGKLLKIPINIEKNVIRNLPLLQTYRHGHTVRGKPPGIARSLAQRLKEENYVDPEITKQINIGFPQLRPSRSEQLKERLAYVKEQRTNVKLEKEARERTLEVNLDEVKNIWLQTTGQYHIKEIANHYGIFEHLFGDAYFVPRVPLNINYALPDDMIAPVYYGNLLKPSDAVKEPEVSFNSQVNLCGKKETDTFWSLLMTNPDGHLKVEDKEYVHWFISNIPGNDISKGELIVPYLQPFPPKGTGYHRHIFVLYKQEKKLDFSNYAVKQLHDLEGRTFSTLDFYKKYQDEITPAGLAFFQSNWETSLFDFYHNVLNMEVPIYEYDFPKPYIKEQTWFPLREPFNLYMDKYRDPKQIAKEFLERKLAKTHPFNGPAPPLRFPNAHSIKGIPSWLKTEKKKSRLGWGRINDV